MKHIAYAALVFCCTVATAQAEVLTLNYGGFTLKYDCSNRAALRYEYNLSYDNGNAARPSSFYLDPNMPSGCNQQYTTNSYASVVAGYDRGHLVTSNHMDTSSTYIKRANYMNNIVPQVASFNQGIWVKAEEVAECYRDIKPLTVYGGVVYNNAGNDYFLYTHGIRTPDYFWKTIITTDTAGNPKAISWYIPNQEGLLGLDSYIVSIKQLESLIGVANVGISASDAVKNQKPSSTWPKPSGCNLG